MRERIVACERSDYAVTGVARMLPILMATSRPVIELAHRKTLASWQAAKRAKRATERRFCDVNVGDPFASLALRQAGC
jgi:hypothetical protein